jgi:hypothetical protein
MAAAVVALASGIAIGALDRSTMKPTIKGPVKVVLANSGTSAALSR